MFLLQNSLADLDWGLTSIAATLSHTALILMAFAFPLVSLLVQLETEEYCA